MIVIKQIDHELFDVFLGDGWTNWSRVKVGFDTCHVVKGLPLAKNIRFLILSIISKRFAKNDKK